MAKTNDRKKTPGRSWLTVEKPIFRRPFKKRTLQGSEKIPDVQFIAHT
jgi:hypothetical protein